MNPYLCQILGKVYLNLHFRFPTQTLSISNKCHLLAGTRYSLCIEKNNLTLCRRIFRGKTKWFSCTLCTLCGRLTDSKLWKIILS